ncbi:hypothetical protein MBLNU459_g3479t1 [Dothideomycetes sp. NU459]
MAPSTVNVLLASFGGLSLPPTLSIPLCVDSPISSFTTILSDRLPTGAHDLVLSTISARHIDTQSTLPISSLLQRDDDDFLSLRLSARLLGGKGGFGSQLRAAGGRMSSRKNRNRNEDTNGSNRNLDGRRLRTITEAKNLASYLAMKPDMDKKEREEKRKRWEAIVEAAERKQEEINQGKKSVRVDGQWVEAKEEIESKTRDAVMAAMKAGLIGGDGRPDDLERTGSESSTSGDAEAMDSDGKAELSESASSEEERPTAAASATRTFYGWDEDDEDLSDEDDDNEEDQISAVYEGKGKGKA